MVLQPMCEKLTSVVENLSESLSEASDLNAVDRRQVRPGRRDEIGTAQARCTFLVSCAILTKAKKINQSIGQTARPFGCGSCEFVHIFFN